MFFTDYTAESSNIHYLTYLQNYEQPHGMMYGSR